MIFGDSLEALLECVYLGERLSTKRSGNVIYINPGERNDYIVGKTIIFTREPTVPIVGKLRSNMNTIVSRVMFSGTVYSPYITRINPRIQWNGLYVTIPGDIKDPFVWLKEEDLVMTRIGGDQVEYIGFPKISGVTDDLLYESEGGITLLGWALHQVGINVDKKTSYKDLDLIKTKKIVF